MLDIGSARFLAIVRKNQLAPQRNPTREQLQYSATVDAIIDR